MPSEPPSRERDRGPRRGCRSRDPGGQVGGPRAYRAGGSPALMPERTSLPPPHPALRICVVVPACNEEALISSCLAALAQQEGILPEEYEVLLVLDRCTYATEVRALKVTAEHP